MQLKGSIQDCCFDRLDNQMLL